MQLVSLQGKLLGHWHTHTGGKHEEPTKTGAHAYTGSKSAKGKQQSRVHKLMK
jgi:hypothetical protein